MAINSSDQLLLNQTGITYVITATQLANFVIDQIGGGSGGINLINLDDTPSVAPGAGQIIIGDGSDNFIYTTLEQEIKTGSGQHKLEDHTDVNGAPVGDYQGKFLLGKSTTNVSYVDFETEVNLLIAAADTRTTHIGDLEDVNQNSPSGSGTNPVIGDVLLWTAPGEYVPTKLTGTGGLIDIEINGVPGASGPGSGGIEINGKQVSIAKETAETDPTKIEDALGVVAIKAGGGISLVNGVIDTAIDGGLVAKGSFEYDATSGAGDIAGTGTGHGDPNLPDKAIKGEMWVAISKNPKNSTDFVPLTNWPGAGGAGNPNVTNGSILVSDGAGWVTMGVMEFIPATDNLQQVTDVGATTSNTIELTTGANLELDTGKVVASGTGVVFEAEDVGATIQLGDGDPNSGGTNSSGGLLSVGNIDFSRFELLS